MLYSTSILQQIYKSITSGEAHISCLDTSTHQLRILKTPFFSNEFTLKISVAFFFFNSDLICLRKNASKLVEDAKSNLEKTTPTGTVSTKSNVKISPKIKIKKK